MINTRRHPIFFLTVLLTVLMQGNLTAYATRDDAPRVFLDGRRIDANYIRTHITFVNYVTDREAADIHVLITTQSTASGGVEYTLAFMGQGPWQSQQNTLTYCSLPTDTPDMVRRGLTQVLKLGLAPYLANTPLASAITLHFDEPAGPGFQTAPSTDDDPWDHWVFQLRANTRMRGEKSQNSRAISGALTADRITEDYKFRFNLNHWEERVQYDYEDYQHTETAHRGEMTTLLVRSLGDHWSVGGWFSLYRSSFQNLDLEISPMAAIEYNVFPYAESTRRQLRVLYRFGYAHTQYHEETIYQKTRESLWSQALSVTFEANEPWGYGWFGLEGRHYIHDLSKRRLTFNGRLSMRLFKGFSLNLTGRYTATQDQLGLARSDASLEDLLLQKKELASAYRYDLSVGLGYRFGSLFSNIVNPRFGGSNRSPSH